MQSVDLRFATFVLPPMLLSLALSAAAQAPDTVTIEGQTKKTVGTITAMQDGDIACYLSLKDDLGGTFQEMADFELCGQKSALIGQRVKLTYRPRHVQSSECQGNPGCKKSALVLLVVAAVPTVPPAGSR
jgi:hypothetical protein